MDRWRDRVALVTGASAGIGAALVRTLTSHGLKVVACARNLERLQALRDALPSDCPGSVLPIKCDVSDEKQILEMFNQIQKEYGRLDVCINNAGLAFPAPLSSGSTAHWREMWEVNVLGLSMCTREALKLMNSSNVTDGHVIHISSLSGHRLVAECAAFYTCTKHAVKALTEGLRLELLKAKNDTRVTSISPGVIDTEFSARKHRHDENVLKKKVATYKELDAQDIVDAVMYALSAPGYCQVADILLRPTHQPT